MEGWEVSKERRRTLSNSLRLSLVEMGLAVVVVVVVGGGGLYNGGAGRVATAAFRMGRRSPLRG